MCGRRGGKYGGEKKGRIVEGEREKVAHEGGRDGGKLTEDKGDK